MRIHLPRSHASMGLPTAPPHALGSARSANERVIGMVQAAHPSVRAVLEALDLGPFSRLSPGLVNQAAQPSSPYQPSMGPDDDVIVMPLNDLDVEEAAHLNAVLSDPFQNTPDPDPLRPTPADSEHPWAAPWAETLTIDQHLHLNVWNWALLADRPGAALDHLRPWVDDRLATLGETAREDAVNALLDDRWGLALALRQERPEALRAVWHHVTGVLENAQGPWPEAPAHLPSPAHHGTDAERARAWTMGALMHRLMAEGDPVAWAVPVLTELGGGPQVWTESRWPMKTWGHAPGRYHLQPVAHALASFCFQLAEAMVRTGIDPNTVLDALPVDDTDRDDEGFPTGPVAPAPTLLGVAWGAWLAVEVDAGNAFLWAHPLPGLGAIVALLRAGADPDVPLLRQHKPINDHLRLRALSPFRHEMAHAGSHRLNEPRLVVQTVEQSMMAWMARLPEGIHGTVSGESVRQLKQRLESVVLHRLVAESCETSTPRARL